MSFKSLFLVLCLVGLAMEAQGAKKYLAYYRSVNFFQAWQQCRLYGGHLASIESEQENGQVAAAIKAVGDMKLQWLIGGTDIGFDGSFIWIGLNQEATYLNFLEGEPNNHNGPEDCLTMGHLGTDKWNDVPCDFKAGGFVCAFAV
uniref:C-type lectin domain-containing protein n=1 Tax=Anopheles minimus TaxID=112268 RepID=A0A182WE59_9DIPT